MTSVRIERDGGVAELVLCQAERGNPFDEAFCRELCDAANQLSEDPGVRAILIRAEGRYFSVGADLKWLSADPAGLPLALKRATADLHMAITRLARGNAPIVIAVHALATGGAVALTALADFAIAARSAEFYAAYCRIGFVSDGGGSYFIPRRVGLRAASDFLLRNQRWSAEVALARGLVSELVADDDLLPVARALAAELADGPTVTFGELRRLLLDTLNSPLEVQLEAEAQAIARAARTGDCRAAVSAVAKREHPTFVGR